MHSKERNHDEERGGESGPQERRDHGDTSASDFGGGDTEGERAGTGKHQKVKTNEETALGGIFWSGATSDSPWREGTSIDPVVQCRERGLDHEDRGSTRENAIFSNCLWTNSDYPNPLKCSQYDPCKVWLNRNDCFLTY